MDPGSLDLRLSHEVTAASEVLFCPATSENSHPELRGLRSDAVRRRNSLAGTFKLPSELLSQVFEERHREGTDVSQVLVSVCWRWRAVGLDTPRIWANIVFWDTTGSSRLLQLYLTRSNSCPLDVEIHFHSRVSEETNKTREQAFAALRTHVCRYRRLAMLDELPSAGRVRHRPEGRPPFQQYLQLLLPADAKLLEYLCIDHGVRRRLDWNPKCIDVHPAQLPALTRLELRGDVDYFFPNLRLPSLTELDIGFAACVDLRSLQSILQEASLLRRLCLPTSVPRAWTSPAKPQSLPNLHTLSVAAWPPGTVNLDMDRSFHELMRLIDAPSLNVFHLEAHAFSDLHDIVGALKSADNSIKFPLLTELHLSEVSSLKTRTLGFMLTGAEVVPNPVIRLAETLPAPSLMTMEDGDEEFWIIRHAFEPDCPQVLDSLWPCLNLCTLRTPSHRMMMDDLAYFRARDDAISRPGLEMGRDMRMRVVSALGTMIKDQGLIRKILR